MTYYDNSEYSFAQQNVLIKALQCLLLKVCILIAKLILNDTLDDLELQKPQPLKL